MPPPSKLCRALGIHNRKNCSRQTQCAVAGTRPGALIPRVSGPASSRSRRRGSATRRRGGGRRGWSQGAREKNRRRQAREAVPQRQVQHLHAWRHGAVRERQDAEHGTATPVWARARGPHALHPSAQRCSAARFGSGCLPEKRFTEGPGRWSLRQSGPRTPHTAPGRPHLALLALWGSCLFWGEGGKGGETGSHLSPELRSRLTATLNSWTQVILLPWPAKVLGLQVKPLCLAPSFLHSFMHSFLVSTCIHLSVALVVPVLMLRETLSAKPTVGYCGVWDDKDMALSL
ncbi:uncharacterized protein [Macaca nemestrina]|uniref:uncharacterized protein n=1 Tax=Macaca nemestrina TaxID=9545 RepID=UPI0039B87F6C